MRDSRKPTPTNEAVDATRAESAARLVAQQVREARTEIGWSQQSLAEAMGAYGFAWRQTTVAKVEAADRPVLFTEVLALSHILARPVDYFFEAPDAIQVAIEEATRDVELALRRYHEAQASLNRATYDLMREECVYGVAMAARSYRASYDSGVLRHELDGLYERFGGTLVEYNHAYKAVPVLRHELDLIDREALKEVAEGYLRAASALSEREIAEDGAEILNGADDYLRTGEADPALLSEFRRSKRWGDLVCFQITELFVDRIDK
ncbi:helix-turn-helix transcriptional regulator [Streptomyces sp. NPDC006995]|uniref:helix-turn-helix domain-containing protein n=1 Tax=Streptomyces sp. NPDC006995 TaxID=3156907 RepID=UPI0033C9A65A